MTPEEILAEAQREGDDTEAEQEQPQPLTVRHFLAALAESQEMSPDIALASDAEEIADPRTRVPTAADADDPTAGIAPEGQHTPYLRRDGDYDQQVSQACRRPEQPLSGPDADSEGLSTELLAAEVLGLFRDPSAPEPGSAAAASYKIARHLRSILLFELEATENVPDPVPLLIDLGTEASPTPHTLAGDSGVRLKSIEHAAIDREYDFLPGRYFQSDDEIALAWDFRFEESRAGDTPLTIYEAGFETFRVTRTNLSRSRAKPVVADVTPCWLDPGDGTLIRPQFQFVDNAIGGGEEVGEGDLLQYRVDAIGQAGPESPLAYCLFHVVRQTVQPLPAPAQALALHLPRPVKDALRPGVYRDEGDVEIAVQRPEGETDFPASDLVLTARLVPAPPFGAYGFATDPDVATEPRPAIPPQAAENLAGAGAYVPTILFAEPRRGTTLPWEEAAPLTLPPGRAWTPIAMRPGDDPPAEVGLRLRLTLEELFAAVCGATGVAAIPPGQAVEISVGRVKRTRPPRRPDPRSSPAATRCCWSRRTRPTR